MEMEVCSGCFFLLLKNDLVVYENDGRLYIVWFILSLFIVCLFDRVIIFCLSLRSL